MSFSSSVKNRLARLEDQSVCCLLAELSAITSIAGSISLMGRGQMNLYVETENAAVARRIFLLYKRVFEVTPSLSTLHHSRLGGRNTYRLKISGDEAAFILEGCDILKTNEQGHVGVRRAVPKEITARRCCKRAFLRGAFLAGGSLSNPEREYRAEFVISDDAFAGALLRFLAKNGLDAKMITRKEQNVIYFTEGDRIGDLLTFIGATQARIELEEIRINKELRNNTNRAVNCDSANMKKTAVASERQTEAIEYLKVHYGLDNLPAPLRELALLRLDYREATLTDLGEMLDPPVGKSGVNHRMRKILAQYQNVRDAKGETT